MTQIDLEALELETKSQLAMEAGEWLARRLLEKPELIKTMPNYLWAIYQTWLDMCRYKFYNEFYETEFREKMRT